MVDSINENGLRLVLSTNSRSHRPDTYVFGKETPPQECLGEPVINLAARDMLGENMKWIASKENLLSLAMMTVSEGSGDKRILTQRNSGRTTIVRHGQIEFNGNIGGVVIEKGGWLSGSRFTKKDVISGSSCTPWGLYGSRESLMDIKISNALIEDGFKSALSLGFIPLNPEKTKTWLLEKFKDDKKIQEIIDASFFIVNKNGDVPVLDFRVGGVEYRIEDSRNNNSEVDWAIQKGFLAHSAKLLKEEITKYPKRYQESLKNPERVVDYINVLEKVGKRIPLTEDEKTLHEDVYISIGKNNEASLEKFLKRRKDLDIGLRTQFIEHVSASKDVCLAGFTYDYEQMDAKKFEDDNLLDFRKNEKNYSEAYLTNWDRMINFWYAGVVRNCVSIRR